MAKFVDGFVLVVPKDKGEMYKEMATGGRDAWMNHGALNYFECRGTDLTPHEHGDLKTRAFAEMTGATEADDVWFSFITFASKEHRDEVNKKVMDEMTEQMKSHENDPMPFEVHRMSYGGFQVEVEG